MIVQILFLIFGFALLIFGANILVKGASNIAKKFHVPEILIGLTIVSLGTTLPELVVSIVSAASNSTDLVLGNVIGSNLCNLLFILGIIVMLKPIKFEKITIKKNLPLLMVLTILIMTMGIGILKEERLILNQIDGIILLSIAIIYMSLPIVKFFKEKNEKNNEINEEKRKMFLIKQMINIVLGGLALKFGGDFAVNSSTNIAEMLNISERVIGITIVAVGTSLPELITSVVAILRGNEDIAEGNIVGACIINSSLVLGAGAVISNIPISKAYIEDLVLLLICLILIWLFGFGNKENKLNRINGFIIFSIYVIYTIRLILS